MKEKEVKETIKGRSVYYTVRFYSRMRFYYIQLIDDIPVPGTDPFSRKQDVYDFIECFNLTGDMRKSLSVGFRPEGMTVEQYLKERES